MDYCPYNCAFDNSLNNQIKKYDRENNIKHKRNLLKKSVEDEQRKHKLTAPYENVAVPQKVNDMDIYQSYFTAQGDLDKNLYPSNAALLRFHNLDQKMNQNGTKISDLQHQQKAYALAQYDQRKPVYAEKNAFWGKNKEVDDDDSTFSLDSSSLADSDTKELSTSVSTDRFFNKQKKRKKHTKYSHNYYIKKFLQDISNDGDTLSLTSSLDDIVYDHIKKCKYCKTKINKRLNKPYQKKLEPIKSILSPKILPETILGYDIKEIIIVILIGICLIFILDLFVKIGRKTED